jgi:hypothetical protein
MAAMNPPAEVRTVPPPVAVRRRRLLTAAAAAVAAVLAVVLYAFPPAEHSFYPRCLFHDLTGLHCPGCGGTRCAHALLHGDPAQAAAYNLLAVLGLPYLALLAANGLWYGVTGRRAFRVWAPAWWPRAVAVAVVLFWVARNLPWTPFTFLAPHKI